jgi:hypothetical protein
MQSMMHRIVGEHEVRPRCDALERLIAAWVGAIAHDAMHSDGQIAAR